MKNLGKTKILDIKNVCKHFPIHKGVLRKVIGYTKAVNNVSIEIYKGETLGIVGESGCGKTTLGKCILQLYHLTSGNIFYEDVDNNKFDILNLGKNDKLNFKKKIQVIFQDPYSSLNPSVTIRKTLIEPLKIHKIDNPIDKINNILSAVNLDPDYINRYPHEFSGGQRQRIGIARALSLDPEVVICDEPVSALDVSIQAQVLELLLSLQKERNLTYIFITHDISVVEYLSNRVAVMYLGEIVEILDTENLVNGSKHPYTEALVSSVPVTSLKGREKIILEGDVPDPSNPPSGCHFHPRCRYAMDICKIEKPLLRSLSGSNSHFVSCHLQPS